MNLQSRQLGLDSQGEDVASLHNQLQNMGGSIDPAELTMKLFGNTTRRQVLEFQKRTALPPTGVVDEDTATAIKRAAEGINVDGLETDAIGSASAANAMARFEEKKLALTTNEGAAPVPSNRTRPELQPLIVRAKFAIFTFDKNLKISQWDFSFFELSAEISGLPDAAFQVLRCTLTDNLQVERRTVSEGDVAAGTDRTKQLCSTQLEFPTGPRIVAAGTSASVRVVVKSFEGTVWSEEFKADEPRLRDLYIEVPLQRPITLTSSTQRSKSSNEKKLRGQVLELGKKCKLKDLTVVIQAKARGDTIWRIVGAARTDSTGSFSLPYPFGLFDEAQALVSVTPNTPVTVKVTEPRNANETIAEDFLYLLVKDIDCPQDDGEADCDCNGNGRTARLPNQVDLIGSDDYTQDLGGSCINLSTPNRTLSEFNYQAIVRTSDPDVANYTLQKLAPEIKPAGIDRVHMLEISRALSAVDSGLKNVTFQNALPPAVSSQALAQVAALRTYIEETPNADVTAAAKSLDVLTSELVASLTQSDANAPAAQSEASPHPQSGTISAATIEIEVARVVADVVAAVTAPAGIAGGLVDLSWETLEGAIRQAVINVGGAPLTPTFFFQFGGWRLGAARDVASELLREVTEKAAAAGAAGASAIEPSRTDVPARQSNMAKAVNYVVGLADDLKAYLNAAQLLRIETRYQLVRGAKKRVRERVDLDNLVAWQDDEKNMTLYEAVTVATGHVLHYKCEFKADGYSLGDLAYSLPLAPGQKKEIVVFDASHRLMATESQALSQTERLAASIINERAIISGLGGYVGESLRGASSANTSGVSAGFGTGGQGYGGGTGAYGGSGSAVIGVAGGVANANSNAWQDSSRNISQHFDETLRNSITQNADAYRQLNASVVTTVEEGQRYGVTSEVVANHNHCHALTIMYFEVLRHYAIFQRLSSVEECVFVPLLMTNFAPENIYKWRDVLVKSLLPTPSDTYLQSLSTSTPYSPQQPPLARAFDANERITTSYANVDYPVGSYDDETIQFIRGNLRIRVELPRPRTRFDRIMSLPVTKQLDAKKLADAVEEFAGDSAAYAAKAAFTAGLWTAFQKPPNPPNPAEYEVLATEALSDAFMSMDANYQSVPPAQCMRIVNFKPHPISFGAYPPLGPGTPFSALDFFAENLDDKKQWQAYADILGYSDVEAMLNAYFKGNLIAEWDSIFYTDIAPLIFEKIVSRITLSEFSTDFSSETKYAGGEKVMRLNLTGASSKKRNQLPLELNLGVSDQNFKRLQNYITFNVEELTISYSTAHYNGVLYSGSVGDDLFDDTALYIPETSEEKRNPRKEDAYLAEKLIEHLNSNIEYYNKALWYNLDADRRYMLLDGFDIQVFNEYGLPIGRRSLASVVKNELITVTGNSLVFPVAAGYRVSQSYIVEHAADGAEIVSLLDHYQPLTPPEPYRISVPTKGVFAEAVPGTCNACEKIETDRLQDWNRFPDTDEPAAISPVTVSTPDVTDWKAAFKDFATPMVNIQNAPALPSPGEGMQGLTDLLGKAGVFKDITGLDANQQNVIRTYLSNQENAKAFAEMAKEMAMQQHNTGNSGKIMDQITAAKKSKDITQQEASQLVKDHLQQQIDGGATKNAELEEQANSSPITQAVVDGATEGKKVTVQTSSGGGRVEYAEIGAKVAGESIENTDRFITSNFQFHRDLLMAIANFGTHGRMDGQNLSWQVRGVEGERSALDTELLAWKSNANQIVLGNAGAIVEAIIAAVRKEVFASPPGPSFSDEVMAEAFNKAIEVALVGVLGEGAGEVIGFIASIAKLKFFEAAREHDMESREKYFEDKMRAAVEIQGKLVSEFYNLDTLLRYYSHWLDTATPDEFLRFRIPFTPERVNVNDLTESISIGIQENLSEKPGSQGASIDSVGLFAFLQSNGIMADSSELERALSGGVGVGVVQTNALFPANHFRPVIAARSFSGVPVNIIVLPAGRSKIAVPSGTVAALDIDPGIFLGLVNTGQHALYDLQARTWVDADWSAQA